MKTSVYCLFAAFGVLCVACSGEEGGEEAVEEPGTEAQDAAQPTEEETVAELWPPSQALPETFGVCTRTFERISPPGEGFTRGGITELRVDDRGIPHALFGNAYYVWTGERWATPELPDGTMDVAISTQGVAFAVRKQEEGYEILCLDADLESWHHVTTSNPDEHVGFEEGEQNWSVDLIIPRDEHTKLVFQRVVRGNGRPFWRDRVIEDLTADTVTTHRQQLDDAYNRKYRCIDRSSDNSCTEYMWSASNTGSDGLEYGVEFRDRVDSYHGYPVDTTMLVWANGQEQHNTVEEEGRTGAAAQVGYGNIYEAMDSSFAMTMRDSPSISGSRRIDCMTLKIPSLADWPALSDEEQWLSNIVEFRNTPEETFCGLARNEAGLPLTVLSNTLEKTLEIDDVVVELVPSSVPISKRGVPRVTLDYYGDLHIIWSPDEFVEGVDSNRKYYQHIPQFAATEL